MFQCPRCGRCGSRVAETPFDETFISRFRALGARRCGSRWRNESGDPVTGIQFTNRHLGAGGVARRRRSAATGTPVEVIVSWLPQLRGGVALRQLRPASRSAIARLQYLGAGGVAPCAKCRLRSVLGIEACFIALVHRAV